MRAERHGSWKYEYREHPLEGGIGWMIHSTLPFMIALRTPAGDKEHVRNLLLKEIEEYRAHGAAFSIKSMRSLDEEMTYRPMRNFDIFPPGYVYGIAWDDRVNMWAMKTPGGELIYENDERL